MPSSSRDRYMAIGSGFSAINSFPATCVPEFRSRDYHYEENKAHKTKERSLVAFRTCFPRFARLAPGARKIKVSVLEWFNGFSPDQPGSGQGHTPRGQRTRRRCLARGVKNGAMRWKRPAGFAASYPSAPSGLLAASIFGHLVWWLLTNVYNLQRFPSFSILSRQDLNLFCLSDHSILTEWIFDNCLLSIKQHRLNKKTL
jgi:hypothetical protein